MTKSAQANVKIEVTKDGPYLVSGGLPLSEQWIVTNAEGDSFEYREGKKFPAQPQYALCRCGQSAHKPFCDGTHTKVGFDGTETASHEPYLNRPKRLKVPRCGSPTSKICARSPGSAIQKAGSGIWSRNGQPRSSGNCKTRSRPLPRRTISGLGSGDRQADRTEI